MRSGKSNLSNSPLSRASGLCGCATPWLVSSCLLGNAFWLWLAGFIADGFTGSMADVPKDLLQEIERLERLFTIPKEKLKEITAHFVKELEKGIYYHSLYIIITNIQ